MGVYNLKYRSENSRLVPPFKTRNSWNRATSCSVFFLVLSFSCPSVNSSSDEFRLWKRFVWFEAIFLKKNTPKLLDCVICQSRGTASEQHRCLHWWKSIRRFSLVKKNRRTNELASLAWRDYFYRDAFWRLNLGMHVIITFYRLSIKVKKPLSYENWIPVWNPFW